MRALVIGGGMAGLFAAIALREAKDAFDQIDVFEQTALPTAAGAGLNIAPNGARLCHWLGIDLDGGDPKTPSGVVESGRAAIMAGTRNIMPDLTASIKPFDYNAHDKIRDGGGFHHMHRQDLLMCLHKRALELGPSQGVRCPLRVHMGKRIVGVEQDESSVTAMFEDGTRETGEVLIGADGINSRVRQIVWPTTPKRRWTGALIFRGLVPRAKVESLRKRDGSPLEFSPMDGMYHDWMKREAALCLCHWVRGGELLNVAIMWYEPASTEFPEDWSDWRPIGNDEIVGTLDRIWADDSRKEMVLALGSVMENPTKWGLYDRDAFDSWIEGRVTLAGDAAHAMLPTFGQGASQSFEDGAALSSCFNIHGKNVADALLHYERVRHYRATRFQFGSKVAFKALEPKDSRQRQEILKATNERDMPIYDHEQRAADDDSWIYEFDARQVGDTLPTRRWGPWDYRSKGVAADVRGDIARNLWTPETPHRSDGKITRADLAQHATFEDCWVVIAGKVYDFTEWKDHHPGGPFVARLYAGKDATAEFGDFHSKIAMRHMQHFCVGDFVGDGLNDAAETASIS